MLEEDLRPFFPDKRTTIPDVKQGILEGLKLRQTVMERQRPRPRREKRKRLRRRRGEQDERKTNVPEL